MVCADRKNGSCFCGGGHVADRDLVQIIKLQISLVNTMGDRLEAAYNIVSGDALVRRDCK